MKTGQRLLLFNQSPFAPTRLPSLKEWLRADLGTWQDSALTTAAVADGDPVGGWVDQSGQGKNAVQATAGLRLTLKLGANGIGGKPALQFGGTQYMATAAFAAALTQPSTLYFVFVYGAVTAAQFLCDGIGTSNRHALGDFISGNRYSMYAGTQVDEAVGSANTSKHVLSAIFNGASSQVWIDNTSKIGPGDAGANTLTGLTVGARFNAANPLPANSLVSEIIVYNAAHTAAQRAQVQAYLALRYGITLS